MLIPKLFHSSIVGRYHKTIQRRRILENKENEVSQFLKDKLRNFVLYSPYLFLNYSIPPLLEATTKLFT